MAQDYNRRDYLALVKIAEQLRLRDPECRGHSPDIIHQIAVGDIGAYAATKAGETEEERSLVVNGMMDTEVQIDLTSELEWDEVLGRDAIKYDEMIGHFRQDLIKYQNGSTAPEQQTF